MEEMVLTDKEVLQVLACCYTNEDRCDNCPLYLHDMPCNTDMYEQLLKIVRRLQARVEQLHNELANAPDPFPCKIGSGCEAAGSNCYTCENNKYGERFVKNTTKEILQSINRWLDGAISYSYDKSEKGSIRYGGMNIAFHEVKALVEKIAKDKGVEVEDERKEF